MSVKSVNLVITKQARIKKLIPNDWGKRNFVRVVINTPFIKRQSN